MSMVISLAFFASLSLNLIVQFGLGIQKITKEEKTTLHLPFFQTGVLFVVVVVLWFVFSYIIKPISSVFFEYLLLFPLSVLSCMGLEALVIRFFPTIDLGKNFFNPISAYNGLVLMALILTIHIAVSFIEAVIVCVGFSAGILFSILILIEIRKRSSTEAVPSFLRGKPLVLISMGFLSLIFTSAAAILLNVLGRD